MTPIRPPLFDNATNRTISWVLRKLTVNNRIKWIWSTWVQPSKFQLQLPIVFLHNWSRKYRRQLGEYKFAQKPTVFSRHYCHDSQTKDDYLRKNCVILSLSDLVWIELQFISVFPNLSSTHQRLQQWRQKGGITRAIRLVNPLLQSFSLSLSRAPSSLSSFYPWKSSRFPAVLVVLITRPAISAHSFTRLSTGTLPSELRSWFWNWSIFFMWSDCDLV